MSLATLTHLYRNLSSMHFIYCWPLLIETCLKFLEVTSSETERAFFPCSTRLRVTNLKFVVVFHEAWEILETWHFEFLEREILKRICISS